MSALPWSRIDSTAAAVSGGVGASARADAGAAPPAPLTPPPAAPASPAPAPAPATPADARAVATPPPPANPRSRAAEPEVFWAEHEAWLREARTRRPRAVGVGDPQQQPRSLSNPSPPVTYLVTTTPGLGLSAAAGGGDSAGGGVRRRYSDFDALRVHLLARFPGILLPQLPEKRFLGGRSETFLVNRQRGLLVFLERVVADPYLFLHDATQVFLTGTEAEWDAVKKATATSSTTTGATPASPSPSSPPGSATTTTPTTTITSEERWRAAVTMSALPANADAELHRARSSLGDMEESLKTVTAVAVKASAAGKQYSATVGELARALVAQGADPQRPLGFLAKPMEAWSDATVLEPLIMEEVLVEALMDEIDVIRELRSLVDARDGLAQVADHALRAQHKLEVEKEQLDKMGQTEKANRVGAKIQEALRAVKAAEYRVEFATKALFYAGLTSYVASRVKAVGLVFARLATAELRYGEMLRSVWLGVCSSVGVDVNEFNRDEATRGTLSRLEARAGPKYKGCFLVEAAGPGSGSGSVREGGAN